MQKAHSLEINIIITCRFWGLILFREPAASLGACPITSEEIFSDSYLGSLNSMHLLQHHAGVHITLNVRLIRQRCITSKNMVCLNPRQSLRSGWSFCIIVRMLHLADTLAATLMEVVKRWR